MPRRAAPPRATSRGETSPKRAWTLRHVAVVVSAVILGTGMGYAISKASQWGQSAEQFLLSEIEIIGNEVLTEGEVVELSGLTTGTNLLSIRIASVERAVESSPRVERARTLRLLPDRIIVRIEERKPAALVATAAFGFVEVTDDGLVLPPVERTALADLPLIVGAADSVEFGGVAASGDIEYVLELLRTARAIEPALWMEISEIRIAPGSGLVIYTAADGAEIRVGSGALDSRDLKRLWMVLTDLKSRGDVVESIDFRYKDQAVVRLRAGGARGRI